MTAYPNLLSPLQVGSLTLSNRMVMGAMHTRLETLDQPLERLAAFYTERAEGEIALMLTGGYAPVPEGVMEAGGPLFNRREQLAEHRFLVQAVQKKGGRLVLQILHAGRYARVPDCVAPSAGKARINPYSPRVLDTDEVWATIKSYVHTAALAQEAGYTGVEIMGSEGYLINEFTAPLTNQRSDEFGGSLQGRMKLAVEIVKAVRQQVGADFLLIYRLSAIDLMEGGMCAPEIQALAQAIEQAGADMINTGIGWHESAVPTIAASVPRAAWTTAVAQVKAAVTIPVMASNRINTPAIAEQLLASGAADLVSMARPLLADPDFARKVRMGQEQSINTCIACNQSCLDRIFSESSASCLVNPRAGQELDFPLIPASKHKRVAVIGAGPAGMACALYAARRGHKVSLFEASGHLGGQLNLAKQVPGKNEFNETLRYFSVALTQAQVHIHLKTRVSSESLQGQEYDEIVVATGVRPRCIEMEGAQLPMVLSYEQVLSRQAQVGKRVAIIGAGGIGFDVAEFLSGDTRESQDDTVFFKHWGVDPTSQSSGGIQKPDYAPKGLHEIYLLQRKSEAPGKRLGKTTGWVLKSRLRRAGVQMMVGVSYTKISPQGLHYVVAGEPKILDVDTVIVCAGQESNRDLYATLQPLGLPVHIIGGAEHAVELDAARAIEQGMRLAYRL
ncbi:FAD-dependent oxidoreductase [Alcaligenes endophyticus]|uniref:FAD-dependent oxidoreductase n=1 Tax=Alcaligenes endophyticus TaxID=1929088 RepID=A0ABT8EH81_9BURK|nr:FAD-dependent oxidoreductase [Alcaligenes endophyticus]MCX5589691.1 FAD-dependent oxidoreductase [Alcaligenes endophyticus]MDN4120645.1 FAD-dependent oxidoreductase [Alcaligenes endophyticus]